MPTDHRIDFAPQTARRAALGLGLAWTLALSAGIGRVCAEPTSLEYQVKAAFLVRLATFVEWPHGAFADAQEPIRIGILGTDPFGSFFDEAIRTESANGRPLRLKRGRDVGALAGCQIIFIAASEEPVCSEILERLHDRPVLTVADLPRFAERGGMVNFAKDGGRVRVEVNLAAAGQAGLKISAKLLQIARVITPAHGKGGA